MVLSTNFWDVVKQYVQKGDRVAELYHGEWDDILRGLSKIVSEEGIVYGVDKLNPFQEHPNMRDLQNLENIKLLSSTIPPIPSEVHDLDAIIIREFIWTYPLPYDGRENPETYDSIDKSLKQGAVLILHLNRVERESESGKSQTYQNTIRRQLPNFNKIYHNGDLMIFRKGKT